MKLVIKLWQCAVLACLVLWLASSSANAQTVRGGLAGTVTDSSGAVVPGAKIQAKNEKTGDISNTVSSSAGTYHFAELPLGTYDLVVTAPGFQTSVSKGALVQIQQITALNVTLQAGGATETVTVNASAQTLQTESSDVGGVVSDKQIVELPLALGGVGALRSPEAFEFLLPGTVGPGTANGTDNGVFFSKIAGGQNFGNEVLIDGVSQQRSENGSSFDEEAPSVEALQEFKITTALPQAEYGRTTGGLENFVTKSGTNSYHGTAYELFRNTALDANTWFNNGEIGLLCGGTNNTSSCKSPFVTPEDKKNDYGVTLGGPIRIPRLYNGQDKLFFFFSWEQLNYTVGATTTSTVPTAAELAGNFSDPRILTGTPLGINPCDGSEVLSGQIFNPATTRTVNGTECRTAYPGNKITSGFSPAAKNILSYFPAPTNPNLIANNYFFPTTYPINNTAETIRVDANLSQSSKIWASYNSRENNRTSGTPALPYPEDYSSNKQDFTTHFGRFGWDYSFSPTVLNHFIFGTNRSNSLNHAFPIFDGINWTQKLGIGNADSLNFPVVTNGFTDQEGMPNNGDNIDNGLRLNESVAWEKGAHSFMFGADLRYQQYSPINANSPSIGFCGAQTSASNNNTLGGRTGNGLASELLGEACGGGQSIVPHQSRWISWYYAGFVQDDWKISRNLTLNLGLRYSVDVPRHEAENQTSNFSYTALDPEYGVPGALVFGTTCHCNTKWADTWTKDWAPRIGFAYTPPEQNGNTVLRGGAGIFYGPLQYDDFGGSMNTGYRASPSFNSPNGFDPSFQIDAGYPAFSQPPDLDPGYFNGQPVSGSYIQAKAGRPAAIYDWTLQLQQKVATDLIMTIGYVGNRAQNLQANVQNINNMPLHYLSLGNHLNDNLMGNTDGVAVPFPGYFNLWGSGVHIQQALRPFPQYDYIDSGCCLENPGHSSYDALLVSLNRRFHNGLNLLASYTWAHNFTDADSALPNTNPGIPQEQNPDDMKQEKSISIQDIPQIFVISYLYELPFGHDKKWLNHGVASIVGGGWEVGGIQRYQSGQPSPFCCASGLPGWEQSIRFDRIQGRDYKSAVYHKGHNADHLQPLNNANGTDPNVNSLYNGSINSGAPNYDYGKGPDVGVAAFYDQNQAPYNTGTQPYYLGDTPRITGEVRTPSYYNEDFSLIKNTTLHEGIVLQLKAEFLNAFNRHTFAAPDSGPGDFNFGVPTYTIQAPRNIQITGRINF